MGGSSAMGAVCFTHPLDLVKVHLQTQKQVLPLGMVQLGKQWIEKVMEWIVGFSIFISSEC